MSPPGGGASPAEVARLLLLLRRTASEIECQVQGRSMEPAIPHGASLRIRLDGAAGAGSDTAVALLLGGDTFSVHRLVHRGKSRRARGFVLTHGDGNLFCDAPLAETALLGSVLAMRTDHDATWRPVPGPVRRRLPRRWLTALVEAAVRTALELDPRLGTAVKSLVVLLVTPWVWLRPYQAGSMRSSSRLLGPKPVAPV